MKIIAGEKKGHILKTPEGRQTRPTLSRVRESLFSIIAGDIPGCVFCDLFAGTGAIGLEALSRGADKAIFVEAGREPFRCLKQNIEKLHYADSAQAIDADATRWNLSDAKWMPDIIFADPPYQADLIKKFASHLAAAPLQPDTLIILQIPAGMENPLPEFKHLRTVKYGPTALHFYLGG